MRVPAGPGQRVIRDLRGRSWAHMIRLPVGYFERQKAGRLLNPGRPTTSRRFSGLPPAGLVNAVVNVLTAGRCRGRPCCWSIRASGWSRSPPWLPSVLLLRLLNRRS